MYTIKIDNEYLPNGVKIKSGSMNLNQGQAGERAVLSFSLIDMNLGPNDPYIWSTLCGKKIELYEDGILIFGGQLDEPETIKINQHPIFGEKITCIDWHCLTDRVYINQSYPRQLISETFKEMIDDFLSIEGVWYDSNSIKETTSQYVSINCPYVLAGDAFDEMASLINWQWRIGPDKKIYLNEYNYDVAAPLIENVSNYLPKSVKIGDDRSEYYNKKIFKDVNALTDGTIPEKATPTPNQDKGFFVRFPLNQKPEIYITQNIDDPPPEDMVDPRQVGIGGLDTGLQWYWNKGSNIIQQDADAEPITDYLVLKYVGQYKINIIAQNNEAIAERQAIEGGSGIYTNVENADEIEGIEIAEEKAAALIERYSRIATKFYFASYTINLNVGQIIDLIFPSFNVDTSKKDDGSDDLANDNYFLIIEKKIKDVGPLLLKTYVLIDGAPIGGWIKFFSKLIKPGKDWTIRPDAIVDIPIDVDDNWDWGGTYYIRTYDCLYPVDDPGGLYPADDPGGLYPGTITGTTIYYD